MTTELTVGGADILELITQARAMVLTLPEKITVSTARDAQELLADLVKLRNMIDKQRADAKAPHLDAGRKIDALAKTYTQPLDDLQLVVRGRLQVHLLDLELERRTALAVQQRAEELARAEAEKTGQTPALAASAAVVIPDAAAVKTRDFAVKTVVDITKVPSKYLIVDWAEVEADMAQGSPLPPGLDIRVEKRIVAR